MKTRTLLAVLAVCACCAYCTTVICRHWFAVEAVRAGINLVKKSR